MGPAYAKRDVAEGVFEPILLNLPYGWQYQGANAALHQRCMAVSGVKAQIDALLAEGTEKKAP